MKVGMIQSNYIPWRGYFDFIDDVDLFIFYDDVQYTRKDWRNRNKIKTQQGLIWLTVPVKFSMNQLVNINDATIDYSNPWVRKHINSIKVAYSKAPFFEKYFSEFESILQIKYENLSDLNIALILWCMRHLNINTETRMSSEFNPVGYRTDRIIDILKKVKATSYLVGPAAKDYIEVDRFKNAEIALEFKKYDYAEYNQLHGKFEPNVSVMDLMFNCGDDSRKYLKSLQNNEKAF